LSQPNPILEISDDKADGFTLREDLKWSDGLTAEDVVFTYQDVIFNKQIPPIGKIV